MGFINDFKQFAVRGNVVDLSVGVVVGSAFGKIISSLVDDIITPAILTPTLKAANLANLDQLVIPGTAVKYGNFLSQVIAFVLIAFVLFLFIQAIIKIQKKEEASVAPALPTKEETLLTEIRDILKEKK